MLESSRSLELDSFLTRSLSSSSLPSSPEVGGGGFISASRTAPVFLGRDLAGSIFLFWLGAYGTTWFFWPSDDNLRARNAQVPYQKTSSGDILLDFELNRPLIDPPTIPCKTKERNGKVLSYEKPCVSHSHNPPHVLPPICQILSIILFSQSIAVHCHFPSTSHCVCARVAECESWESI